MASILLAGPAWATNPRPDPDPVAQAEAEARAYADAEAEARAHAEGGSAYSDAQGGEASSSSSLDGSNNTTTSNESNFFALSTTFPQVSGCFSGKQGGAGGEGIGIWLGGHKLDLNCFLTSIAEAEPDIEVAARLKCGSAAFRDAIAYEIPRRRFTKKDDLERQTLCVNYMTLKHRNELSALRERAEFLLQERNRIESELTERNKLIVAQCAEKLERSEEAWLECLTK